LSSSTTSGRSARRARLVVLVPAFALLGAALPTLAATSPAHATGPGPDPAVITFTTQPPDRGVYSATYIPQVTSSDPAVPIDITVDPTSNDTCEAHDGTIDFLAPGVCVINASQTLTDGSRTAPAQQSVVVGDARTCAEDAAAGQITEDGTYEIDMLGTPAPVYCSGVSTGSPKGFITLPYTGGTSNYSGLYTDGKNYKGTTVLTHFTKVAVNTLTGQIDPNDLTYATSAGGPANNTITSVAWGTARACLYNSGSNADADLRGSGFTFVNGPQQFSVSGYDMGGQATWPSPDHVTASNVTGQCASFAPNTTATQVTPTGLPDTIAGAPLIDVAFSNDGVGDPLFGQTLTFAHVADQPAGATVATTLTGLVAGNTATYTTSGACTVDQDGVVTGTGAGSCTVMADAPADGDHLAAIPAATTFQFQAPTDLTLTSTPASPATAGDTYTPTFTSGDTSPVTVTATGDCSAASGTVTYTAKGDCTITATQPADALHRGGTVTQTATILGVLSAGDVTLDGSATVGVPLTATTTGWDPAGTLSYAWKADGTAVGTDSDTYTPVPADLGKAITVTVTSTADGYVPTSVTSDATDPVAAGTLTAGTATLASNPQVGDTLYPIASGWDSRVTSWSFTWKADGQTISGADTTSGTYQIAPVDAGKRITVTVTGSADGYNDVAATSNATNPVTNAAGLPAGSVQIGHDRSGTGTVVTAKAGQTLYANTDGWDPQATLHHAWTVDGRPAGTDTATFTVPASAAGKTIGLTVTSDRVGYDPVSATSSTVLVIKNPTLTVTYTVAGHRRSASVVTNPSHWSAAPVEVRFTCRPGTSPIATCPAPVALGQGRHRSLSWTATGVDGGKTVAHATEVNVDTTAPVAAVSGIRDESIELVAPKHVSCKGRDNLSGIASCKLTSKRTKTATGWKVTYTATVTDRAGHRTLRRSSTVVSRLVIVGARFAGGRFHVTENDTYQVVVAARTQPRLVFAAPTPVAPAGGYVAFHRAGGAGVGAGVRRWTLPVGMTPSVRYTHDWTIGVQVGTTLTRAPIYVSR